MTYGFPIGVFDSGVGGLTVVREIFRQIPHGDILYFGDTAHVPYGPRRREELIRFADKICQFLIDQGARVIVDACNSTSAVALDFLQEKYDVPIIGVIEPGVETALAQSRNGKVGLIATEATVSSKAHKQKIEQVAPEVVLVSQACPLFVPLVEQGKVSSPEALEAAKRYLAPLKDMGIDSLILGCTHYPFLAVTLQEVLGSSITLVDPAKETVHRLKEIIEQLPQGEQDHNRHRYFVSGDPVVFSEVGNQLMDKYCLDAVEKVELDWGD